MELTAAQRVLLHLHGFWNVPEPGREATQAGIAEAAHILRSHVPRTLRSLLEDGLADVRETRLRGQRRKARVYVLTEAGVREARQVLTDIDRIPVDIDGRQATIGEARKALGLSPLAAIAATDPEGRFRPMVVELERPTLLQREDDLAFLRRWLVGGAPVSVVYGSRGMGKTAIGWAFAETTPRSAWVDLAGASNLRGFATSLAAATGTRIDAPEEPDSVAGALRDSFGRGTKLLVVDGYGDVEEPFVDALRAFVRTGRTVGGKLLVLAQESTPAYCRFYSKSDVDEGLVVERHLKGLDPDGCRAMLGRPDIDGESLRQIYLLTKGCPLYLRAIREGDDAGLRAHSRFTTAEIRFLLYSGSALRPVRPQGRRSSP
jgi:DNA-binding MarR family transcriptional regulator